MRSLSAVLQPRRFVVVDRETGSVKHRLNSLEKVRAVLESAPDRSRLQVEAEQGGRRSALTQFEGEALAS